MVDLFEAAMTATEGIGVERARVALRAANEGALRDALDMRLDGQRTFYYRWSQGLVKTLKPKQVVELGGAMGVWSLMVLQVLPKDSNLYSITLAEDGKEFSFVVDDYPNFHPIVGNDLEMDNWKDVNLEKTDLWFFDALHEESHLRKELELYSRYFKKGAVILVDDIHSFGLDPVWEEFKKLGKHWDSDLLHYSGFGVVHVQ